MKQLIIDRKKWRTGGDSFEHRGIKGHTSLYNDRGYSCCLVLPIEKNWDDVFNKTFSQSYIEKDYPNGVIIQPKQ